MRRQFRNITSLYNRLRNDCKENRTEIIRLLVIILVCYILFGKMLQISYIPTGSMEATIMTNDVVLFNRISYCVGEPQQGDIIEFYQEKADKYLCKRVIGSPGDTISFQNGKVYINGEQLNETQYISDEVETYCNKTFTVPEDSYFVMGDNRSRSFDSRYWKNPYVSNSDIKAKLIMVIPMHYIIKNRGK